MRLHFIQHVPFERPAAIGGWARKHGFPTSVSKIYRPPRTARAVLPTTDEFDVLVVLGGPMGVGDVEDYPWLEEEVELIHQTIRSDRKVVGICLGAQLIAKAMGAAVKRARFTEIGWFPVLHAPSAGGSGNPIAPILPEHFPAFHWHNDAFEVPDHATLILESEACPTQGFVVPHKALALQFHLELSEENVEALLENCRSELVTGRFVQTSALIRKGVTEHGPLARALLERLLDWFLLSKTESVGTG